MVVKLEIDPERLDEFHEIIKEDIVATRAEKGCIRFDVVRSKESLIKFSLFEVYKSIEAKDFHMGTPHVKALLDFKESGGIINLDLKVCEAIDVGGADLL